MQHSALKMGISKHHYNTGYVKSAELRAGGAVEGQLCLTYMLTACLT